MCTPQCSLSLAAARASEASYCAPQPAAGAEILGNFAAERRNVPRNHIETHGAQATLSCGKALFDIFHLLSEQGARNFLGGTPETINSWHPLVRQGIN